MKRFFLSLIVLVLVLGACAPAAETVAETAAPQAIEPTAEVIFPTPEPVDSSFTVIDALDREVTFAQAPTRIAMIGRGLFMIADAIYMFPEASERVIAIGSTTQGDADFVASIDPNYDSKTIFDREAGAEQVAAVQADLVIMRSSQRESLGVSIEELGIAVVYIDFELPEDYAQDFEILGQVFQNPERAAELAAYYTGVMNQVQDTVADVAESDRPSVLLIYYSDRDGAVAFNVAPAEWLQTRMVEMAGGNPIWLDAATGSGWNVITLEQIAAWDPDIVLVLTYTTDANTAVQTLQADSNWAALRATQEGHLYAFPADYYSWDQPDPRWALGMLWVQNQLYPELTFDVDIMEEARTFYSDLYGLDELYFNENIQILLQEDLN